MDHGDGLTVGSPAGVHGFNKAEVVGVLGQVWPEIADPLPALAVLFELPDGVEDSSIARLVFEGDIEVVDAFEG